MNQHETAEQKTLQKAKRRHKKKNPGMKMSGKGLKRFAQPKKSS